MLFILAQVLGAFALICSIIGLQQKASKNFLFFQVLINVLYTLQYFCLNATAGLSMAFLNVIRCIILGCQQFFGQNIKRLIFCCQG